MVGRPSKKTPDVIRKIEEIAALDGTVEEMAFFANLNPDTIYDWMKKDKEFSERIKALRNNPVLLARRTVVKKMTESYSNAADYLKRKRKKEFGDGIDVTSDGERVQITGIIINEPNKD